MKLLFTALIHFCLFLASSLLITAGATAQSSKLDDLASQIVKELKPFKPRLVVVADVSDASVINSPQGHYFAWMLSSYMEERSKSKFAVANHIDFDRSLASLNITPALVLGDSFQSTLGADVLITGTIEKRGESYFLQITLAHVPDRKSLDALTATVGMTELLESFVTPLPADIPRLSGKDPSAEITMPTCIYCPDPQYNDSARQAKIQGVSGFEVLISASGKAQQIHAVRLLGYGLDEHAIEAIKTWKLKPARTKKDGTPVPVIVPVEVTFRLF